MKIALPANPEKMLNNALNCWFLDLRLITEHSIFKPLPQGSMNITLECHQLDIYSPCDLILP